MGEVTYGRTPVGQQLYDFGFAKLSDKWLAQKYGMPIADVRDLKAKVEAALNPKKQKKAAKRKA